MSRYLLDYINHVEKNRLDSFAHHDLKNKLINAACR